MHKPNRVLVIGLDGATWDVLDPWISDGSLPHLARLRQSGSWGALLSSIPPISAPAWSTFMTGKGPGRHSVFHFADLFGQGQAEENKPRIVNARSIQSSALWDILGHNDRKVVLINVPMTYPPRPVNGIMITGLLTPKNAATFTYPPELAQELTDYIIDVDRFMGRKPFQDSHEYDAEAVAPTLSLIRDFRDMLERRGSASLSLMDSRPWDLFMVVFTGTDRMGHYLWSYHHLAQGDNRPNALGLHQAIREYYIRLDEIVDSLVTKAGEEVAAVIMSDHGFGPIYSRRAHWNSWLLERGWLFAEDSGDRVLNPSSWLKRLRLPRDKVGRILRQMPGLSRSRFVQRAARSSDVTVDTNRSKAYCVPIYHYVFGIRVNAEGEEKESLREEITDALVKVTDPQTGQRIVQRVYRGEEYYRGPYAHNIPEIIVVMDPDYTAGLRVGHYSSIATVVQPDDINEGDHRVEGIFLVSGPGIRPGGDALPIANIEDIAPTILHLMNLPIPSDMDGRPLTEIMSPDLLQSRPIRKGKPVGFWPNEEEAVFSDQVIADDGEEQIRDRLRALGYIE
jgi:predicted AlkP superfamily phosphohydrolase/phosphomutase